jgi:hypothetical protein
MCGLAGWRMRHPGQRIWETPATVILRHVIAELLGGPRTRDNGGAVDPPL